MSLSACTTQVFVVRGIFIDRLNCSALRPYVTQLIVCDPRHNGLISRGNKNDRRDAFDLRRLLRLGEFVEVFHSDQAR